MIYCVETYLLGVTVWWQVPAKSAAAAERHVLAIARRDGVHLQVVLARKQNVLPIEVIDSEDTTLTGPYKVYPRPPEQLGLCL